MSPFSNDPQPQPLERELAPGETLIWHGRPNPTRLGQRALGAFAWTGAMAAFTAFWVWKASEPLRQKLTSGQTPELATVAFPAFGLLMLFPIVQGLTAPWREMARAKRLWYGLTNQRVLLVEAGRRPWAKSIAPSQLALERHEGASAKGDLILCCETTGKGEDARTEVIGFWGIDNVAEVERLIRETLLRAN